jgi:hypothetical protein
VSSHLSEPTSIFYYEITIDISGSQKQQMWARMKVGTFTAHKQLFKTLLFSCFVPEMHVVIS